MNQQNYAKKLIDAYSPKKANKLEDLKRLDKKAKRPALIFSLVFGILGSLVLGFGMSIALEVLSFSLVLGIVLGSIGLLICLINYFLYKGILKLGKKKYGEKIISLSQELLNETN